MRFCRVRIQYSHAGTRSFLWRQFRVYAEANASQHPLHFHTSCQEHVAIYTIDDRFLKRAKAVDTGQPKIVSPLELITEVTR